MNYKAMNRGDYLKAVEFDGKDYTLTIVGAKLVKLEGEDGKAETKGVVFFKETDRGMVCNVTNAELLAAMFGPETDAWAGKRVTIGAAMVKLGKDTVPGIRVKGSPELTEERAVEVKLPRRKPVRMVLVPTRKVATQGQEHGA